MRIRHNLRTALLLGTLLASVLAACAQVRAETPEAVPSPAPAAVRLTAATPVPEPTPDALRLRGQSSHPALMRCDGSGAFFPAREVTRIELCRCLAGMLAGFSGEEAAFSDYRTGNADFASAAALAGAGILPAEDGALHPREAVTRGEMSLVLNRLSRSLSGRAAERAAALSEELLRGFATPSDLGAGRDGPLTRAELAYTLVTLAGRAPDAAAEAALFLAETLPEDVSPEEPLWAYIADAVTEGKTPRPGHGVHRAYGWLYAVWEDGTLIRDMDWGVWSFGADGAYTTGIPALDDALRAALADSGANRLEGQAALKAAYLYVKEYGEYLVRPEDEEVLEPGAMGWEYERADRFFRYGGGTCYGYAAAFGLMARALGREAYIVSAQVNQYYGAHAFVVIPEDGVDWVYDVELEDTRPERHEDLDLFRIEPLGYYNYWYETDWEGVSW